MYKNKNKLRLSLLAIIPALGITFCNLTYGNGLLKVYKIAAKNDPQLHQAFANFKSVEQNIPIAVADLLPEVIIDAGIGYDKVLDFGQNQSVIQKYAGITGTQPLFYWDRINRYLQSNIEVEKAIHDLEVAKEDLLIRVSDAYFNILDAEDSLEFVTTEKAAVQQLYDESAERFKVGLIPAADLDEAKARLEIINADEIRAKNDVANRYEDLREILGEDIKNINVLTPKYWPSNPKPTNIEQWVKLALDRNHLLRSETLAEKVTAKDEDIAFAGHLPSIDAVAFYRDVNNTRSLIIDQISAAKGHLSLYGASIEGQLEVFGGLGTQAGVEKAEFNTIAAKYNTERARREAVSTTRQAYRNVVTNINQVKALEQAVKSGLSALEATRASYEVGTRASIDVLDRLTDLYEQKQRLSSARYDYIRNVIALKRNAGVLTDKDMKVVDSWLISRNSTLLKQDKSAVKSSVLEQIKELDVKEFEKIDPLYEKDKTKKPTEVKKAPQTKTTEATKATKPQKAIDPEVQPKKPAVDSGTTTTPPASENKSVTPILESKSAEKLEQILKDTPATPDTSSDVIKQLEDQLKQLEKNEPIDDIKKEPKTITSDKPTTPTDIPTDATTAPKNKKDAPVNLPSTPATTDEPLVDPQEQSSSVESKPSTTLDASQDDDVLNKLEQELERIIKQNN